ncbi:sulfatase family protein [Pigmentiphaga kullae]|uniref:Arylsulfatase A-like enzyme n=1 Tax=Pigmentiphaga kullae TaxID=151784 RepID=A0A4Q7NIN2_9BURK|nr:sulfatase-like hydrolase/transferase [Pigmentiphaga kullae]RZS84728.1 arylsulfatase A-like enzyme [Pigmentiphaga kullae]
MRQPNILLIMTDQHRADHLGCYGNRQVRTPHIDGIAARGTVFDRFYVASPICMPNRSTLMTGRMPSLHGVRHNGIPLRLDDTTFATMLGARGYRTALIGKSHLQNMQDIPPLVQRAPHEGRAVVPAHPDATGDRRDGPAYEQELASRWRDPAHRIRLPYYGFDHVELCMEHGDEAFGDYQRWLAQRLPEADGLRGRRHARADDRYVAPQAWRTRLPEACYPSRYIAERGAAYLEAHAARGAAQPFFLKCSFPDPHHPFTPPGRYWGMYDPRSIAVPPTCAPPAAEAPPHLRWLHDERAGGRANLDTPRVVAVTPREAREAIALSYGMITLVDDCIGRILQALEATGQARDTIVAFTSDHGDFMGDHGLLFKGPLHYQGLVRVPFIWADPRAPGGRRSAALHGTLDIAQTLLHRTGTAPYHDIQGMSLLPALDDPGWQGHDAVLIEDEIQRVFGGFDSPVRLRTLITRQWRLSVYLGAEWGELYDLANDPHERVNLWHDPRHAGTRASLMEALVRKMMALASRSPLPTRIA